MGINYYLMDEIYRMAMKMDWAMLGNFSDILWWIRR